MEKKFNMRDAYLLSYTQFRKNRLGENHTYYFLRHSFDMQKKIDTRDAYLLSYTQFRKNRLGENHTLLFSALFIRYAKKSIRETPIY